MSSVFETHPDILRLEQDQGLPRFLLDALEHLVAVRWVGGHRFPGEPASPEGATPPELQPHERWLAFLGMRLGLQLVMTLAEDLGHEEAVAAIFAADNIPPAAQESDEDFYVDEPLPPCLQQLAACVYFGPRVPEPLDRTVVHGMHLGLWVLELFEYGQVLADLAREHPQKTGSAYRYRIDMGPDGEVVLSRVSA